MKNSAFNILYLIILGLAISSCQAPSTDKEEVHPNMPELAIEQFSVMEATAGKLSWVLDAANAQISDSEKRVLLKMPKIKFFENGKYLSTLTAKRGRIDTTTYDIWAEDDCQVETADGEILRTKNLHYRSDTKKVVTDAKVLLIRKNEIITGKGMEATPNLESIKIRNQKVVMRNPEETNESGAKE